MRKYLLSKVPNVGWSEDSTAAMAQQSARAAYMLDGIYALIPLLVLVDIVAATLCFIFVSSISYTAVLGTVLVIAALFSIIQYYSLYDPAPEPLSPTNSSLVMPWHQASSCISWLISWHGRMHLSLASYVVSLLVLIYFTVSHSLALRWQDDITPNAKYPSSHLLFTAFAVVSVGVLVLVGGLSAQCTGKWRNYLPSDDSFRITCILEIVLIFLYAEIITDSAKEHTMIISCCMIGLHMLIVLILTSSGGISHLRTKGADLLYDVKYPRALLLSYATTVAWTFFTVLYLMVNCLHKAGTVVPFIPSNSPTPPATFNAVPAPPVACDHYTSTTTAVLCIALPFTVYWNNEIARYVESRCTIFKSTKDRTVASPSSVNISPAGLAVIFPIVVFATLLMLMAQLLASFNSLHTIYRVVGSVPYCSSVDIVSWLLVGSLVTLVALNILFLPHHYIGESLSGTASATTSLLSMTTLSNHSATHTSANSDSFTVSSAHLLTDDASVRSINRTSTPQPPTPRSSRGTITTPPPYSPNVHISSPGNSHNGGMPFGSPTSRSYKESRLRIVDPNLLNDHSQRVLGDIRATFDPDKPEFKRDLRATCLIPEYGASLLYQLLSLHEGMLTQLLVFVEGSDKVTNALRQLYTCTRDGISELYTHEDGTPARTLPSWGNMMELETRESALGVATDNRAMFHLLQGPADIWLNTLNEMTEKDFEAIFCAPTNLDAEPEETDLKTRMSWTPTTEEMDALCDDKEARQHARGIILPKRVSDLLLQLRRGIEESHTRRIQELQLSRSHQSTPSVLVDAVENGIE
eukprot:TRINITY_DN12265_c0_g1_i1.p1 TRINITY_DN12265_c0_g1~~TRINITY_DN12265_c0_g1_i1.p1  ORF type:complete len:943 (+),score=-33.95 TRINITY_DN12265_c0_g1_i1:411-2831(+)